MARRKNFTPQEISEIISLKSQGLTWRDIAVKLNSNKETVRAAHYTAKKKADLPPKEKICKSSVKGRLALLAKKIKLENPQLPYRDIPGKIVEAIGPVEKMPSYKAFERYLRKSNFCKDASNSEN